MNSIQRVLILAVGAVSFTYILSTINPHTSEKNEQFDTSSGTSEITFPEIITVYRDSTFPVKFEASYVKGTTVQQGPVTYTFSQKNIGKLKLNQEKLLLVM